MYMENTKIQNILLRGKLGKNQNSEYFTSRTFGEKMCRIFNLREMFKLPCSLITYRLEIYTITWREYKRIGQANRLV